MKKKRKRTRGATEAEMDLTPMIDVVFQLLIFFVVTLKPIDVIGNLDVFRPAPDPHAPPPDQKVDEMLRLTVLSDSRYRLNDRWMGLETIEKNLKRAAARSTTQTVLIQCSEQSAHGSLVAVLDLCAKVGLTNLSVATLNI